MPRLSLRPGVARTVSAGGALVLALGLAACGSQLDPAEVAGATGGSAGTAQGGEVVPGTTAGDTTGGVGTTTGGTGTSSGSTTTGGGTTASGSTAGGATSSAGAGAGGGGGGGGQHGGAAPTPPTAAATRRSCDGFKNGPGITDAEITIGNASDISGPVPGPLRVRQEAVKAYVAYFNATSDICGRKLELKTYDSRTDAAADQQAYAKGCDEVVRDGRLDVGVRLRRRRHRPELRPARHPLGRGHQRPAGLHHLLRRRSRPTPASSRTRSRRLHQEDYPDAAAHAALLYINAGAGRRERARSRSAAMDQAGHALRLPRASTSRSSTTRRTSSR